MLKVFFLLSILSKIGLFSYLFTENFNIISWNFEHSYLSFESSSKILLSREYLISFLLIGFDVFLLLSFFACSLIGLVKLFIKDWMVASLFLGVLLYNLVISVQPVTIGSYPRFRMTTWLLTIILAVICFCKNNTKRNNYRRRLK